MKEKIAKIYEVIALRKQNTVNVCPRCESEKIVIGRYGDCRTSYERYECSRCGKLSYEEDEKISDGKSQKQIKKPKPVMIGDVLDWMFQHGIEFLGGENDQGNELLTIWGELRKPIDYQMDGTLNFIYSLVQGGGS